ncbi:MAG: DUF4124 domain-containing protein, partial [Kiritimatiellaeota bacterium]|nr:DUF4124 domain-containing protein [Kiritimatiellota bacterium]
MKRKFSTLLGLVLLLSTAVAQSDKPMPLPEFVFATNSFWYTAIPVDAPLHTNSANFVAEFLRQKKAYYGTVSINTRAYAAPVY